MILNFINTPCLHSQPQALVSSDRGYKSFTAIIFIKKQLLAKYTGTYFISSIKVPALPMFFLWFREPIS